MPRATRLRDVVFAARRQFSSYGPRPSRVQPFRPPSRSAKANGDHGTLDLPPPTFVRSRAFSWAFCSMLAGGIGFYSTRLFIEGRKPVQNPAIVELSNQKDVSGVYNDTANTFDAEVGLSEVLMGINRSRKTLAKQCTGHVLEVSCGTGRNLGYFDIGKDDSKIESLTFVDLSPQMIEVCMKKWQVLRSTEKSRLDPALQVRFMKGSALAKMPLAPNGGKYATIIQTMGLCSTPSPVELLANMVKYLDTSNVDARILLLEHGRSSQTWLNNILDNAAEKHAEIHGCWFNRDVGALVEDAARQTGLEVVRERRRHFGTTWIFELKPGADLIQQSTSPADTSSQAEQSSEWRNWLGWK